MKILELSNKSIPEPNKIEENENLRIQIEDEKHKIFELVMQIANTTHKLGYTDVQNIMLERYGFTFMKVEINTKKRLTKAKTEKNAFLKIVMFVMFLSVVKNCSVMY